MGGSVPYADLGLRTSKIQSLIGSNHLLESVGWWHKSLRSSRRNHVVADTANKVDLIQLSRTHTRAFINDLIYRGLIQIAVQLNRYYQSNRMRRLHNVLL
jgi:hypothetical protein